MFCSGYYLEGKGQQSATGRRGVRGGEQKDGERGSGKHSTKKGRSHFETAPQNNDNYLATIASICFLSFATLDNSTFSLTRLCGSRTFLRHPKRYIVGPSFFLEGVTK